MFILYIMIYNLLWSCNNPILNSIVYCFREQPFKLENKQFKQTFLIVFLFNKIYKYCVFRKWNTTTWDFSFFFWIAENLVFVLYYISINLKIFIHSNTISMELYWLKEKENLVLNIWYDIKLQKSNGRESKWCLLH
jgi:hypothetical protein